MPMGEEQEAAKLLFIKAGESKERVPEDYLVWALCWLQMQPKSKTQGEASEVGEL